MIIFAIICNKHLPDILIDLFVSIAILPYQFLMEFFIESKSCYLNNFQNNLMPSVCIKENIYYKKVNYFNDCL